ncbi:MAG: N-acetyltransferase [Candidatus Bathyarchaeum sp.]|nr:MAG: N-acetyltransferase [Candidatus Bathyarchaeum sp.]
MRTYRGFEKTMTASELTIRLALPKEWKFIVDFFDEHLHNMYHDPGFLPLQMIRDKIDRGNCVIAESEEGILGVALTNGKTLWNLVIHKEYRNRGVGTKLLKSINPRYVRIKYKGGLPDPTNFYEKNGYRPLGLVKSAVTGKKTILLAERVDEQ